MINVVYKGFFVKFYFIGFLNIIIGFLLRMEEFLGFFDIKNSVSTSRMWVLDHDPKCLCQFTFKITRINKEHFRHLNNQIHHNFVYLDIIGNWGQVGGLNL